jgi:hypothetical protein
LVNWILSVTAIYSSMYGIGKIIFSEYMYGFIALAVAFAASFVIYLNIRKEK